MEYIGIQKKNGGVVEARFADGSAVAIDCIAVEDEYGNIPGTTDRTGLAAVP